MITYNSCLSIKLVLCLTLEAIHLYHSGVYSFIRVKCEETEASMKAANMVGMKLVNDACAS